MPVYLDVIMKNDAMVMVWCLQN